MWPCGLVHTVILVRECGHVVSIPLFVTKAKTTWFGIPNFCNAEEEWVGHGVGDLKVSDSNDE